MTGPELRAWRNQQGYSQPQLALMLGVHKGSLSRWESGVHKIPYVVTLALRQLEAVAVSSDSQRTE